MQLKSSGIACAVMLAAASSAWASLGVVLSEDFEIYSSTEEMSAVWAGSDGVLMNEIDEDLYGEPEVSGIGNFAYHPGGSTNTYDLGSALMPTKGEWIQLTVDIYDIDTSANPLFPLNARNKRMSLGLRSTAPANFIELGIWNATPERFAYRGIIFQSLNGTANPNWQSWDMGTEVVEGEAVPVNRFRGGAWYTLRATIKPESVLYEIDFNYDGTFDYAAEHFDMSPTSDGFNQLRFGGPSGVTSPGGGVAFDNIVLEVVAPEPTSAALVSAGLLMLLRRQ